jgi:hypothetical protein
LSRSGHKPLRMSMRKRFKPNVPAFEKGNSRHVSLSRAAKRV